MTRSSHGPARIAVFALAVVALSLSGRTAAADGVGRAVHTILRDAHRRGGINIAAHSALRRLVKHPTVAKALRLGLTLTLHSEPQSKGYAEDHSRLVISQHGATIVHDDPRFAPAVVSIGTGGSGMAHVMPQVSLGRFNLRKQALPLDHAFSKLDVALLEPKAIKAAREAIAHYEARHAKKTSGTAIVQRAVKDALRDPAVNRALSAGKTLELFAMQDKGGYDGDMVRIEVARTSGKTRILFSQDYIPGGGSFILPSVTVGSKKLLPFDRWGFDVKSLSVKALSQALVKSAQP